MKGELCDCFYMLSHVLIFFHIAIISVKSSSKMNCGLIVSPVIFNVNFHI